jgi:hypothetical protein
LKLKSVASAVSLINGVWLVAAGAYWNQVFSFPLLGLGTRQADNLILVVLGVILVLDSAVCFRGWVEALYASAAISALAVVGIAIGGIQLATPAFAFSAFLGLLAIALDILAARRKLFIPEEDHPLNLPVFG